MQPLTDEQYANLYALRLVVLLETAPGSNEYHQFEFAEEEFKKVSLCIADINISEKKENGDMICLHNFRDAKYQLPDTIETWYDKSPTTSKDIKKA